MMMMIMMIMRAANMNSYTLKCFGCGLYGMRSQADFKTTIRAVTVEAGDADTNAAVCGAVLGAKIGTLRTRHMHTIITL